MKNELFQKFIRMKRIEKKLSQLELSEKIGWKSGQYVSNFERGLCPWPLKHLTKLCTVLDISRKEAKKILLEDFEGKVDKYLERK